MPAMKKMLLFLFILLISCSWSKSIHGNIRIWNGKADTKWYSKNKTEFTITTPEQLAGLAKLVNSGNDFYGKTVKLGANIMLNDTADWQNWASKPPKNKWKPIGIYSQGHRRDSYMDSYFIYVYILMPGFIQRALRLADTDFPFSGTFDGGSFAVSGVYINTLENYQGLFGNIRMHKKSEIRNLGMRASYIKGGVYVGGLVGKSEGTVNGCYFIAWVAGTGILGGLVGYNVNSNALISSSYSAGVIAGQQGSVGGLAGINDGTIINSYSSGTVIGEKGVGGLVGNSTGYIGNSYSTGKVMGTSTVGGLVGYRSDAFLIPEEKRSYYNKETSGQEDTGKGTGKTTAEMKQKETFIGWDFDSVWGIDEKINGGYPYLRNMPWKTE
jgi:hypothetical protein